MDVTFDLDLNIQHLDSDSNLGLILTFRFLFKIYT